MNGLFWLFFCSLKELFQQFKYTGLLNLHFWMKSIHEPWRRSCCGLGIQVCLYLTANKAHRGFKVCATTKFSSGEKYNKGEFRYLWLQPDFHNLPALLTTLVCRCRKGERHLRRPVIPRKYVCGGCEDFGGWGWVAVVAAWILSGHLAPLIASLPRQITLLSKHSDLNSRHPLGGQKKPFNWYTAS